MLMGCLLDPETKQCLGVKGVGKDTVADLVIKLRPGSRKFALANGLKQLVQQRLGMSQAEYDLPDRKEQPLSPRLGFPPGTSYRKVLELVGTDVVRRGMNLESAWIDVLDHQLSRDPLDDIAADPRLDDGLKRLGYPVKPAPMVYRLITDVRFPNEYAHYKKVPGAVAVLVRRTRAESQNGEDRGAGAHASNVRYEEMIADETIDNNETIEKLERKVECLLFRLENE
jgi:hypothetical protein